MQRARSFDRAVWKFGHPQWASNVVDESRSSVSHTMHRYVPSSKTLQYSPVKARSVPAFRVTSNCSGVRRVRNTSSDGLTNSMLVSPHVDHGTADGLAGEDVGQRRPVDYRRGTDPGNERRLVGPARRRSHRESETGQHRDGRRPDTASRTGHEDRTVGRG